MVRERFHTLILLDRFPYNAFRQLVLLKRAIKETTEGLRLIRQQEAASRSDTDQGDPPMDALTATMSFLRAAEAVNVRRME